MQTDNDECDVQSEELNYPETLRITVSDADSMFDSALETATAIEAGESVEPVATRAFQQINDLRKLLTDRRIEVLRAIHEEPPDSITQLADHLDRSYSVVHEDVEILSDYGIVHFRDGSQGGKQPYIPYRRIHIDVPVVDTTGQVATGDSNPMDPREQREDKERWIENAVDPREESHS